MKSGHEEKDVEQILAWSCLSHVCLSIPFLCTVFLMNRVTEWGWSYDPRRVHSKSLHWSYSWELTTCPLVIVEETVHNQCTAYETWPVKDRNIYQARLSREDIRQDMSYDDVVCCRTLKSDQEYCSSHQASCITKKNKMEGRMMNALHSRVGVQKQRKVIRKRRGKRVKGI